MKLYFYLIFAWSFSTACFAQQISKYIPEFPHPVLELGMNYDELKRLFPNIISLNLSLKTDEAPTILHAAENGNSYMLRMKDNKVRGITVYWPRETIEARKAHGFKLRDSLRQRIGNQRIFKAGRLALGEPGVIAQNIEMYAMRANDVDMDILLMANSRESSLTLLDTTFFSVTDIFKSFDNLTEEVETRKKEKEKQKRREPPLLPPLIDYLDDKSSPQAPLPTATSK